MKARRGFSLMELVVVLVISVVLAAFAIPMFQQSQTETKWFVDEVRAALRYAQRQAVAQHRPVFVEIAASQVRLCYDAACASPVLSLTEGTPYAITVPAGVTFSPLGVFSFNALGQPTAAQAISVGGESVTVAAETGYVQ